MNYFHTIHCTPNYVAGALKFSVPTLMNLSEVCLRTLCVLGRLDSDGKPRTDADIKADPYVPLALLAAEPWRHNVGSLVQYAKAIHLAWGCTNESDTALLFRKRLLQKVAGLARERCIYDQLLNDPWWKCDPRLQRSHRAFVVEASELVWWPHLAVACGGGNAYIGLCDKDLPEKYWTPLAPAFVEQQAQDHFWQLGIKHYRGYSITPACDFKAKLNEETKSRAMSIFSHCLERHERVLLSVGACRALELEFDSGRTWNIHGVRVIAIGGRSFDDVRRTKASIQLCSKE